ncbi:protein translocase subunit SecD [SAR202 cluster bacterium AD-802-E10_MRT_200m]|nr:protein translocase subunit SecD [SAR202 cluster bacterium AD-802-E10_MRT_200m]
MINGSIRRLMIIIVILIIALSSLSVRNIDFGIGDFNFERGGEGPLGLRLGLDLLGGVQLIYKADQPEITEQQINGVRDIIERRVNAYGVTEPSIQVMGTDRLLIQLPGVANVEEAKNLIGQTAVLEFKERDCINIDCSDYQDRDVGLTGDLLDHATSDRHPTTGQPIVRLSFNSRGARIFGEVTTRIAGTTDRFVIFLDDEELIAPVAKSPILGGDAFIEGPEFTAARVRALAIQLESGRLPVPISVLTEQDVDATLGADALKRSVFAGYIGLALVAIFMISYYRFPGVVATTALLFYLTILLAILKLIPITLTLAGIAGVILSVGMAVDANILIFERIKEELRTGRSILVAVETGFNRAWTSIRDSNVSTFITCAILFWFGSRLGASLVVGFSVSLFIGVAASMFTAIFVSRTLLRLSTLSPLRRHPNMYSPVTGRVNPSGTQLNQGED